MAETKTVERMHARYTAEVAPQLLKEFAYENVMLIPRVKKIAVNIGLGEAISNGKAIEAATKDIAQITGQKPVVTRAKKSIAAFKLRAGMPIGATVTLRGERMWSFLDKLISAALPRVRDFRGVSAKAFDGRGNYTLGLKEQLVFPEIEYEKIDKLRGLEITVVTSARNDEESRRMLELLGMPFEK
jgi:large subunit ribosomal protein L5